MLQEVFSALLSIVRNVLESIRMDYLDDMSKYQESANEIQFWP